MKPVPSLRLSLWYKRKEGAQTQTDVDEIQIHNKELTHGKRKHRQAELHLNGGGGGGVPKKTYSMKTIHPKSKAFSVFKPEDSNKKK